MCLATTPRSSRLATLKVETRECTLWCQKTLTGSPTTSLWPRSFCTLQRRFRGLRAWSRESRHISSLVMFLKTTSSCQLDLRSPSFQVNLRSSISTQPSRAQRKYFSLLMCQPQSAQSIYTTSKNSCYLSPNWLPTICTCTHGYSKLMTSLMEEDTPTWISIRWNLWLIYARNRFRLGSN